ncbi:hypothetical protein RJ639_020954 [Escallonia herrerae]|uniref:Protein kinase domain-containing protein n=1 Tax=Escallonia herrerae TaxID=1293975 RepID=A0AA88V601_9ASTE|nr:hypothetical protein RJ639_020954 [Escallonia herrerae]
MDAPPTLLSFSNLHLLTSNSRSFSGPPELGTETVEHALPGGVVASSAPRHRNWIDSRLATPGRKYSPDRLAGELFFLDASLAFTAELSSQSSYGSLYKATLDSAHMLTVKWLPVGDWSNLKGNSLRKLIKLGIRHPDVVPLRVYYWAAIEQEGLILADYVQGDSLALHIYENTPRRSLPHGTLKPTNILLVGSDFKAYLTDYGLHRLMTPAGTSEQILNLGSPWIPRSELANTTEPIPSSRADVYAFGVILMELLTRSAGDIISGQSGAVNRTGWVRLCDQEGRGMDCIDRDIAGEEEHPKGINVMLAISPRCILPVNEGPNIRQVFEEVGSISG